MKTIHIEKWVDVVIDAEDIDKSDLVEMCKDRGILLIEEQDENDQLVEHAYRDCLRAPAGAIPQSVRDLLWKVHGRAIA